MSKHAKELKAVRSYFVGCAVAIEVEPDGTVVLTFDVSEITGKDGIRGYDTDNMVVEEGERPPTHEELVEDCNVVGDEIDMAYAAANDDRGAFDPFVLYMKNGVVSSVRDDLS
jgi:hypothetical protein